MTVLKHALVCPQGGKTDLGSAPLPMTLEVQPRMLRVTSNLVCPQGGKTDLGSAPLPMTL